MVRFIIAYQQDLNRQIMAHLHSNMVRFIMSNLKMVNILYIIFTFQYG